VWQVPAATDMWLHVPMSHGPTRDRPTHCSHSRQQRVCRSIGECVLSTSTASAQYHTHCQCFGREVPPTRWPRRVPAYQARSRHEQHQSVTAFRPRRGIHQTSNTIGIVCAGALSSRYLALRHHGCGILDGRSRFIVRRCAGQSTAGSATGQPQPRLCATTPRVAGGSAKNQSHMRGWSDATRSIAISVTSN
jgi:hypothetical protein